jgi:hypothetical protein
VKEAAFHDELCDSFGHHTPHLSVYDNAMVLHGQQIPLSLSCSKILSRNKVARILFHEQQREWEKKFGRGSNYGFTVNKK